MNDLETINQIISEAVKDSSYVTVIISSTVFIIYTIIIKITDLVKTKNRNKPLLEMANAIKEISENVVKLNQVLNKTIQDNEIRENKRIHSVVRTSFGSFKCNLLDACIDIIIHNNIDENKESIKQNVYKIASTEYYKIYSNFSEYELDSVSVATKIKEEWIEDITEECLKIIYNKQSAIERIRQLNSKLTLIFNEYSVYTINKVFNH